MKRNINSLLLALLFCFAIPLVAAAQEEYGLTLKLSRDFGYSSGTGDIQGLFSMKVTGPDDLVRVEFFVDDTKIGEATAAPFNIQFTTDDFPNGIHDMYALGYTPDGTILESRRYTANFVSANDGWKAARRILVPVGVILVAAILVSVVIPAIATRGKLTRLPLGEARNYGIKGGAICPKCKRPFAMHLFGLNLGLSSYDRCPYCGKWSVVRSQSLAKLRAAEKAELTWEQAEVPQASEEDKLRKEIEESKFQ